MAWLARLIFGRRGRELWPIVVNQTKAGVTQALLAGVPFEGRTLPLAVYTFEYPWVERAAMSQNSLEEVFLLDLEKALPRGVRGVFIGDRNYARAALLRHSGRLGQLYIIRGRGGTQGEYAGLRLKLKELSALPRQAVRYPFVRYQAQERVPVDVVVFHDLAFREPWYLLVPPGSASVLPTATVVALYRERMQVEQSFRDFKSHFGLRGLRLKVRVTERMGRLLLAFAIAYSLALVLGVSPEALCYTRTCRVFSGYEGGRLQEVTDGRRDAGAPADGGAEVSDLLGDAGARGARGRNPQAA